MDLHAEAPGSHYDVAFWRAVYALYDEAFPGLPAGIEAAAAVGARWPEITTPFALFEGERCVAHVGMLRHPLVLAGRRVEIAGVHAVCTAEDRRGQGLCHRLLARALAWADREHALVKLHTDLPRVYRGQGFTVVDTFRFRAAATACAGVTTRRLTPSTSRADAALLARLLAVRRPVSRRLATCDSGWLVTIVAALSGRLDRALHYLPDQDAIVGVDEADGYPLIVEVIAAALPPAEVVLGAARASSQPPRWAFCPDVLDPGATPEPAPRSIGRFMVRGALPVGVTPVGISPLWEH
jgi:GNAT superfamily N-acetyltransferase